jgi:hypothetical protein
MLTNLSSSFECTQNTSLEYYTTSSSIELAAEAIICQPHAGISARHEGTEHITSELLSGDPVDAGYTTSRGGGAYISGEVSIQNCEFHNNARAQATAPYMWRGAYAGGGAIYLDGGTLWLKNSVFATNTVSAAANLSSGQYGGRLFVQSGTCSIVNATVAYNNAEGSMHPVELRE